MTTKLNPVAFIVVDEAGCFHSPSFSSPIRIIPPYGSEVEILKEDGDWVLLKWCGKEAWTIRSHLENDLVDRRENMLPPSVLARSRSIDVGPYNSYSSIEYGPRGGRFTRTRNGYRRYF